MIQESHEVVHEEFEGVLAVARLALPVSPEIISDGAAGDREGFPLRGPDRVIERKAVDEDEGKSVRRALFLIIKLNVADFRHVNPFSIFSAVL
jgi:hypothetical protein